MINCMKRSIFRIVGIILLILGIRMISEGIWNYVDEHNQKDWIVTKAEIIDSVREYSHSSATHHSRISYDITYQYEVNGKVYSDVLYNKGKNLALGSSIKIKYDPELPEDSTDILKPSLNNLIVFLTFGSIFFLLGFFISGLWVLIDKNREKECL